jgi:hypothetical protein
MISIVIPLRCKELLYRASWVASIIQRRCRAAHHVRFASASLLIKTRAADSFGEALLANAHCSL